MISAPGSYLIIDVGRAGGPKPARLERPLHMFAPTVPAGRSIWWSPGARRTNSLSSRRQIRQKIRQRVAVAVARDRRPGSRSARGGEAWHWRVGGPLRQAQPAAASLHEVDAS